MSATYHIALTMHAYIMKRKQFAFLGLIIATLMYWFISHGVGTLGGRFSSLMPCEDNEAKDVIQQICSLYQRGKIVGRLCQPLCSKQKVKFDKCLNYKGGKVVIQVQCKGFCKPSQSVVAILKMNHLNVSDIEQQMDNIGAELLIRLGNQKDISKVNIYDRIITAESLTMLTTQLLDSEYGFTAREDQDVLELLWGEHYPDQFQNTKTNLLFGSSYMSVVKQNEYRISKVFWEWDVFPTIYGTCGPLYLAEHAPGLSSMGTIFSFLTSQFPPWRSRAKLAIQILHLVQRMDNMEHPLHLCDIKSPHFGFTTENTVRFIDADTVFADKTLSRDLGMPTCTKHEECAFFDCEGWCDKTNGKCTPLRTNNNLQTVCDKIFRGSTFSAYTGLLSSPPKAVAAKLTALIESCADEITETNGEIQMKKPDQEILSTLQRYLLESLNADII